MSRLSILVDRPMLSKARLCPPSRFAVCAGVLGELRPHGPWSHGKLMEWEYSIFLSYLEHTYALLPCSACPAGLGAASTVPRGHQVRLFLVYNFHTLCSPRLRKFSFGCHTPQSRSTAIPSSCQILRPDH